MYAEVALCINLTICNKLHYLESNVSNMNPTYKQVFSQIFYSLTCSFPKFRGGMNFAMFADVI